MAEEGICYQKALNQLRAEFASREPVDETEPRKAAQVRRVRIAPESQEGTDER
jgi:hypothetical protein